MNSNRKTAIIVGILFIISTVTGVLSVVSLQPILDAPDYLISVSSNKNQVIIGALLELICAGAFLGVAVMIFPILKKHNENVALGYVAGRILEAVPFVVGVVSLLSLLTLSQEYVGAGSTAASNFLPLGTLLLAMRDWTDLLGARIFCGLAALPFYYLLYQSKLIPRFISVWGLVGTALYLAASALILFSLSPVSTIAILLTLPFAVNEMVLAVWLIVKGFNSSANISPSAKQYARG